VLVPIDPAWRPAFGGLRHEFRFDPLHYGVGGEQQAAFKARMREELRRYGFLLTGEVQVSWRLLVDEQSRWESDTGADVDNFAKLLDDGLCGPDGILIDDVQVQSLQIHWEAAHGHPSFELTVHCHPDDWITRPASLYELGDGLWYPLPNSVWNTPEAAVHHIYFLDNWVLFVKHLRHQLRRRGLSPEMAFEAARPYGVTSRGFHSTRAAASGFPRVRRREWMTSHARPDDLPTPRNEEIEQAAVVTAQLFRGRD